MELHLFRHGETDFNKERRVQGRLEPDLNEQGVRQARELGTKIAHLRFDHLFCSSSKRTRQTAQYAFPDEPYPIVYMDSLREIYLGPWENELYDDISARDPVAFDNFWEQPHLFQVDGAESFEELQNRAIRAINTLNGRWHQKKVAIISHGAFIKSVLCHFEQRPISELWKPPELHNCAHSIVEIYADGSGRIKQYADEPWI